MFFRRRQDFDAEIRAHLEHEEAELRAAGMSEDEARRQARLRFGSVAAAHERRERASPLHLLQSTWQDLRHGVRLMRRNPGFSLAASLVLALGIGANTALFSVIASVFFTPLAVPEPERVFYLHASPGLQHEEMAVAEERLRDLADLAGHFLISAVLSVGETTGRQWVEMVHSDYFDVLGLSMVRGRDFRPEDADPANPDPAAIVSHAFWTGTLDSDPDVIGRQLRVNDQYFRIVGVAPPDFHGLSSPFQPVRCWTVAQPGTIIRISPPVPSIGRLRRGVSLEQFEAAFITTIQAWRAQNGRSGPNTGSGEGSAAGALRVYRSTEVSIPADPEASLVRPQVLQAVVAVVSLLLVIATANVAGLLLARGVSRAPEMAVRRALGAGGWRLARQLLTETVLLALVGGVVGGALALGIIKVYLAYSPAALVLPVTFSWHVFLFALAISLGAGLLVGVSPALQAMRIRVPSVVGSVSAGVGYRVGGLRRGIPIAQVALSLILLLIAGVHVRALTAIEGRDLGYGIEGAAVLDVSRWRDTRGPRLPRTATPAERTRANEEWREIEQRFSRTLLDRVAALPGVEAVGLTSDLPLRRTSLRVLAISQEDHAAGVVPTGIAIYSYASAGYFAAMGQRLVRGRTFNELEGHTSAWPQAIISESLARELFGGGEPIGRIITWMHSVTARRDRLQWYEVIGMVSDVESLLHEPTTRSRLYLSQVEEARAVRQLVVRARGNQPVPVNEVKRAVLSSDSFAQVTSVRTLEQVADEILYPRRLAATVLAVAGVVGLTLAALGLYGVVSYSVAQRVRELGVRMALGATPRALVGLLLRDGVWVTTVGTIAGLALVFLPLRLTAWMYPDLPAVDPVTFIAVPLLLGAVVLTACFIPARRAARMDPAKVLRGE